LAQPPNNAPSPQPAAFSIVNNWAYPFPARDARAPMTALKFLAALASAEDGFYPLGINGVWHGGIHFGDGTGGTLDQNSGVRCIADGEVVAYRIDTKYPQLTYPDGRKALYSSGFTLVRHHLVLPPVPGSAPASSPASSPTSANPSASPAPAASKAPDPADTLTFFTLYMHVLDWAGYQADTASNAPVKKSLPAYYKGKTISVVGSKAQDAQAPAVTPANAPQPAATDAATPPVLGIHLHDAPNGHNLGILPQGSRLTIGQIHGHWGKIASIESGTPVPLQLGGTLGPQAAQGWVYLKWLDRTGEPDPLDTIVILDPPHSVQAGDVIAYLGEYQRAGDVTTLPPKPMRPMLHLETFTGDDLPSYLARSRARAEQLPAAQRTILVISAGAVLVQLAKPDQTLAYGATVQATADSPSGSLWVKVQQTQAASGNASPPVLQPVGAAFWISYANLANPSGCVAWSTFPLKLQGAAGPTAAHLRAIPIADLNAVAKDDHGNTWYQVPVGVDDGNTALGWVCDKNHPLVKLDSPWAWPGFEALELDASVADLFKRSIHLSDGSVGAEKIPFEQTFEALRSSALLKKLEDILDCRGDRNGKITAVELRGALREPWLADIIQRLIVRYESEWGGEMSKWDALTSLMNDGAPVWNAEMTRINALRFWPGVAAVKEFPVSAKVYHWHPVGLVGNFASRGPTLEEARVRAFLRVIRVGEGTSTDIGYRTIYGNVTFNNFSDHPRKAITAGNYTSTAAGAYQMLETTWDLLVKKKGYKDFTPETQDKAAVQLLIIRDSLEYIKKGDIETAIRGAGKKNEGTNKEWASQPESPYGQPTMTMDKAKILFNKFFDDEINGVTTLKISIGDLLPKNN